MKVIAKLVLLAVCMTMLVACGAKAKHTNLKKEGTEHTINNGIRFYYPNSFTLASDIDSDGSVLFVDGEEILFYVSHVDETDNELQDRDDLYVGELEQNGATNIIQSQPYLNSGIQVYEITGNIAVSDTRFKHIVYFTHGNTYIYGYEAPIDAYNENIKYITEFLQTISISD